MVTGGARYIFLLAFFAMALIVPWPTAAHEGHDHGAPPPPVSKTIAPRADASSADFEVVVVARGKLLSIYLDTFRTNEPLDGATVEIDTPSGVLTPRPVANEPGSYEVEAPFIASPGKYDLALTINVRDTIDILAATLTIPEAESGSPIERSASLVTGTAVAGDLRRVFSDAALPVWLYITVAFLAGLVVARWIWPRRVVRAAVAIVSVASAIPLDARIANADVAVAAPAARDVAQRFPDGAVFVPKPTQRILGIRTVFTEEQEHRRTVEMPGRVVPNPNASGLVQASVGGRLSPPEGGFKPLGTRVKAGDVLAFVSPPLPLADATSQAQQARELDQQIAIVSRKVERLKSIERVIAKSQLEDAELELAGLIKRRANLDRAKSEPEALVAPVDGIIASANAVAGQMAEPNGVIFHIIDPTRLWVEALNYDAQTVEQEARAVLPDGRNVGLTHIGSGFADRNQAIPVHFSVSSAVAGMRVGQFLTVLAMTSDTRKGVAVPREAVLRSSNGQSIVYEHTNAERFVPREVRIEPLDGASVLIVAGIERGRRIVTQGSELLNQVR